MFSVFIGSAGCIIVGILDENDVTEIYETSANVFYNPYIENPYVADDSVFSRIVINR